MATDLAEIFGVPKPSSTSKMGLALLLRFLADAMEEEEQRKKDPLTEPEVRVRPHYTPA